MGTLESKSGDRMIRLKSLVFFVVLTALMGCSAQLERAEEQVPTQGKQREEQRPASVPTFKYRPGAGLMIEGQ
jgi:hypothetical protein